MALTKCKECKNEVSDLAKKCPHCGIANPAMTVKKAVSDWFKGCLILIVLIVVGAFSLSKCSDDDQPTKAAVEQQFVIPDGNIQKFQILATSDYSVGDRKRVKIFLVSPNAKTMADRAATAQQAARDYLHQERLNQVTAILETSATDVNKGNPLAIATYTPDGCGNAGNQCTGKAWEIEATGEQFKSGKKTPLFTRTVLTK